MLDRIYFESERLKTMELGKEDALSLFKFYSDSDAMKYRGSKPMKNIEDAYSMIAERFIVKNQISKLRLGIRKKSNDDLIGTLLLIHDENSKNQCEVGFSFGKDYWRKGYGKETFSMVEKELISHESIEVIKAWCIKENFASIRIFEKAGFSKIKQSEHPQSHLFIKKIKVL